MIKVNVRLYGTLPDYYQGTYPDTGGLVLEFESTVSVSNLVDHVGIPRERVSLVTINGLLAKSDDMVPDGATVKLLQQLSGG